MAELPIAPIGRIIKNAGAQRVSLEAEEALAKYLEDEGNMIAKEAIKIAKHSGKKTVKGRDIKFVQTVIKEQKNINIYGGKGVVTDSSNININFNDNLGIQEIFNNIYQEIEGKENEEVIRDRIRIIEREVKKDKVDFSKIKPAFLWLERNANWIIPSVLQLGTALFFM